MPTEEEMERYRATKRSAADPMNAYFEAKEKEE